MLRAAPIALLGYPVTDVTRARELAVDVSGLDRVMAKSMNGEER